MDDKYITRSMQNSFSKCNEVQISNIHLLQTDFRNDGVFAKFSSISWHCHCPAPLTREDTKMYT